MFSFRTMAGIGAAALAFVALSKISRRRAGEPAGEFVRETTGRVKGIIRRRKAIDIDLTGDVI